MPPAPELTRLRQVALEAVAESARKKQAAINAAYDADAEWRQGIIHAVALGCSMQQIAEVAGVSKGRISQIVKSAKP